MVARVCARPGCPELKPCPMHPPLHGWNRNPSARNRTRPPDAKELRSAARQRDEGVCYWCGGPGASHVDHIQAISDGGTWDLDNMAVMHRDCHQAKSRADYVARGGPRQQAP